MTHSPSAAERLRDPVIWSDVENGAYRADLPLWEELSAGRPPILELGCGSGRVALHLGRRGHEVVAVDDVPELVGAVDERARIEGLPVQARVADIRALALERRFGAVCAPMQVAQLLHDTAERRAMLAGVAAHLASGGLAAFALLDEAASEQGTFEATPEDLVPDLRERDGWVYSSHPLAVRRTQHGFEVHRRRKVVAPDGALREADRVELLANVTPDELEALGVESGLAATERRPIPPTDDHMGSIVVILSPRGNPP